jgi:chemotaxis methyl-accepting protein methylase
MSAAAVHASTSFAPVELTAAELGALLAAVADRTGVSLAGCRPAMLARRAGQRLGASGARSAAQYLDVLRGDDAEAWRLLERLTIKVSQVFRNPGTFAFLRGHVLPELRRRASGRPLRGWSAGCACGEEAYGLSMLCAEAGGPWSVLGTDIDASALARARAGVYAHGHVGQVPAELARAHLAPHGAGAVVVRRELARHVTFAAHDLASGAPPARSGTFDLVACRNVLIYYLQDRQAQILSALVSALAPGGYLVLGEAEWPVASVERRLEVVDRAHRVFRTRGRAAERGP